MQLEVARGPVEEEAQPVLRVVAVVEVAREAEPSNQIVRRNFDQRLAAKRDRLEREFVAMETALARLQGQNNALVSLIGNLSFAQNLINL